MPETRDAPDAASPPRHAGRWELWALLLGALAVYAANPFGIQLRAVDDCFWARTGVEISRADGLFTLAWDGSTDWEYAPLQCWILGRSFAMFGENDLAARLPSIVFAIGTLLIVHRIGVLLLGQATAVTAVALLAISPYFAENARGCMMEVPLAFWVSLTFLVFLDGLRRPRLHALLAIPLGAAIMTKSVLGLMPLPVLGAGAMISDTFRRPLRRPWLWIGAAMGIGLGSWWFTAQALRIGPGTLNAHAMGLIGTYAMKPLGVIQRLTGYPVFLLERFQPVILPAVVGAVLVWRRMRRDRDARLWLLLLWLVVPLAILNLPGTQTRRWLFPLFPPLALCAAWALVSAAPRVASWIRRGLAPAFLAAAAVWLWVSPPPFLHQSDRTLVAHRAMLQARIPRDEPLTYLGPEAAYWPLANPLLYYVERVLEPPAPTPEEALIRTATRQSRLLLCHREMLPTLVPLVPGARTAIAGDGWVMFDLSAGGGASRP